LFRDEKRRKAFLIGIVVFFVVFCGLSAYRQAAMERMGDVILTNGGQAAQGAEGANAGDTSGGVNGAAGGQAGANGASAGDGSSGQAGVSGANGGGQGGDYSSAGQDGAYAGGQDGQPGAAAIFVDVGGAVNLSGLFAMPAGSRVADAIEAAGGLKEEANMKYINRAAVLFDGDRLYIPTESEVRNGTAPPTAGQVTAGSGYNGNNAGTYPPGGNGGGNTDPPANDAGSININTADSSELQKLNGVGPVTAQKIIDYRTKRGGFSYIEELMNVSGIGAKTFEKLKDHITV